MKAGDKFNHQFIVSENVYNGFLQVFNDHNPLHTNEEYALQKNFKAKVMHGNILNGFLSYFIGECLPTKDVIIHSQQINFTKPVYLNDILDFEAEIDEVFESVRAVKFKFNFKNANGQKVAKGEIQIGLT